VAAVASSSAMFSELWIEKDVIETAMDEYEVLCQHLSVGAEENKENLSLDNRFTARDLNPDRPE
jgi:hypothetical protein